MAARIFVSYRRDDAASAAGRLADHLNRRFGAGHVFLDIDTIEPGTDFVSVLRDSLQQTAVVLVVIGRRWTSLRDASGRRRLDDPADFVRLEVETALQRGVPVVPVLVDGAALPPAVELPASLAPLTTRQAVSLDHAEFHDDAERLCDRLERLAGLSSGGRRWWWTAAAAVVAVLVLLAAALYVTGAGGDRGAGGAATQEQDAQVERLLAEAAQQRRRQQPAEALATLERARGLAPDSEAVQRAREEVAMAWIRDVRIEGGASTFGDAIKPALAVVDEGLATARGPRRADLLAHSGWASFLMWRDGNRRLDPAEWYRDALMVDAQNPFANAMLAHWMLFGEDDVAAARPLFERALGSGRAREVVRSLQWSAYGNTSTIEATVERLGVADAIRREGGTLTPAQAQALWSPYYFSSLSGRDREREALLDALAPDDHLQTLEWAFADYAAREPSRRLTMRYYSALLQARGGRRPQAVEELQALARELGGSNGSLRDAVIRALESLK